MKSLSSVCPSVRPSVNFLKTGSLVFLILHMITDYLVTDEARFLKKNWQPEFGAKGPKSGPKLVFFFHFLKFSSLVLLEIA